VGPPAQPRSDGPARTRLVLVHGSRLGHSQWAPQVPLLEEEFDLVLPDLPGHGSRVGEPFTLDRAVGALAGSIDGPGRGRPPGRVVLVGHSLGGYAAMAYAARFPGRLDGLVLVGSAAVPVGLGAAVYRIIGSLTERAGPDRMTRVNDRVLSRLYAPDLIAPVIAGGYFFDPTPAAWREVMTRCRPAMLRHVECPVLVTGGQYDQLMVQARRFARAAPSGRVELVPGAGHLVGFDQPVRLAELLRFFAHSVQEARDGTMAAP